MAKVIGEQIQSARKKAGITQDELASHLETTSAALSRWESGKRNPPAEIIYKISLFLKTDINKIVLDSYPLEDNFLCGNVIFRSEKFRNEILFFAKSGETIENIKRMIFLADILHYKKMENRSLTGSVYLRNESGENVIPYNKKDGNDQTEVFETL